MSAQVLVSKTQNRHFGAKVPFLPDRLTYLNFFDYSLPSLKPSQRLSFEEERPVENKSRSLALLLQLGRRL